MLSGISRSARFSRVLLFFLIFCWCAAIYSSCAAEAVSWAEIDIARLQGQVRHYPLPDRIAFWAERFVGTPYDRDPLGEYVRRSVIVADERVDCMYHVFRSVELAHSATPAEAIRTVLDKRFHGVGVLDAARVMNYDARYAYGEDMVRSGKFGREITQEFGRLSRGRGSRGIDEVVYLAGASAAHQLDRFRNGDLVFFVRHAQKRVKDEVIGHMGIVAAEARESGKRELYLVHAAGMKGKGGTVRKVPLRTYLANMPFAGVQITRFE